MPNQHTRTKLTAWIVVLGLIALALLITLLSAAVSAAVLVDQIAGGDAGLATTSALDSAYQTMSWSFPAFLGVITIGVAIPLIMNLKRKKTMSR